MKKESRKRLDVGLVEWGFVETRSKAQQLIQSGAVEIETSSGWRVVNTPSLDVSANAPQHFRIKQSPLLQFVSRGGVKLDLALRHVGLSAKGFRVLDLGQSTGGFSDCVLQNGAECVIGVEVGSGQLHNKLKSDSRVNYFENLHAGDLATTPAFLQSVQKPVDLIVVDVSFISLTKVLKSALEYLKPGGFVLALVKPQFELDRQALNSKGIVKDSSRFLDVESKIKSFILENKMKILDYFPCELVGQDGNQEFFIYAQKN